MDATGSLESELRELWCQLLGREEIASDADFFEQGGVSLQAILTASWLKELYGEAVPTDVVYKAPTIQSLLQFCGPLERLSAAAEGGGPTAGSREKLYPLAPQSEEFLDEIFWAKGDATAQLILRFPADVDKDRLKAALRAVIHHHDALRMELVKAERYCLREGADSAVELRTIMLEESSDLSDQGSRLALFRQHLGSFDPLEDRLFAAVFVDSVSAYLLFIRASHLIMDQRSSELIVSELRRAYVAGDAYVPSSRSYGYSHFLAEAERVRKLSEAYWEQYLLGSRSTFLTFVDRSVSRHNVVQERQFEAYPLPRDKLVDACRRLGLSEFGLLLVLFQCTVRKYSDGDRFVVSSTFTGRSSAERMQVIGSFSSIVFFSCVVGAAEKPASLAARVSAQISEAHHHMHVSRQVLNRFSGRVDMNRIDIVNFTVALPPGQSPDDLNRQLPVQVEGVPKTLMREVPDISVNVSVRDTEIRARYTYCPGRVRLADVERVARTYGKMLESLDDL